MKTTLYRYFDSEGQLLYVGITGDNVKRQSQHKRNAFWFGQIASATFEHFDSREDKGDDHFVYHLWELERAYKNGERKFQVHESCDKCKGIFSSEWYLGTKQYIADWIAEYEGANK